MNDRQSSDQSTQSVNGSLTLSGVPGGELVVRSDPAGVEAFLAVLGIQLARRLPEGSRFDIASVIGRATTNVTNARSEGLNSKIRWIKREACGYRNRKRFHNAIYFHLADLDLYPESLQSTHTKA